MSPDVYAWAYRHGVTMAALSELSTMLAPPPAPGSGEGSESLVQSEVRLEAAGTGVRLWRNNVGVLQDVNGRPVRYGLANDTKALNARLKSADLIGWRRVLIGPHHVGRVIAQFVSRECKRTGWTYTGTEHEEAQARWAELVTVDGGDACFATGKGTL